MPFFLLPVDETEVKVWLFEGCNSESLVTAVSVEFKIISKLHYN